MTTGTWLHVQFGSWHLVEFIGAGGMGEVYRGVDRQSGQEVAVKILTAVRGSESLRARFANEARIHSSLAHPGIARMIAFASHDGTPAIVLEFVDGKTIESWLASHGPMPLARAVDSMQGLVEAIDYLHKRGTVHRDIKSSNVKITRSGEVKLLDFGIAKGPDSPALTADGSVIGTLQSMAPEQLMGAPADMQSEIWALGVLFYEMLTARHPFAAAGVEDITQRIRTARYPAPTVSNPGLPRFVDAVVEQMPQGRPAGPVWIVRYAAQRPRANPHWRACPRTGQHAGTRRQGKPPRAAAGGRQRCGNGTRVRVQWPLVSQSRWPGRFHGCQHRS